MPLPTAGGTHSALQNAVSTAAGLSPSIIGTSHMTVRPAGRAASRHGGRDADGWHCGLSSSGMGPGGCADRAAGRGASRTLAWPCRRAGGASAGVAAAGTPDCTGRSRTERAARRCDQGPPDAVEAGLATQRAGPPQSHRGAAGGRTPPPAKADCCAAAAAADRAWSVVPWWVQVWYELPLIDRYAHAWMWSHGGWEVRPPFIARPGDQAGVRKPRGPVLPGVQPGTARAMPQEDQQLH